MLSSMARTARVFFQDGLEMHFQPAVLGQQIVEVAVEKAVLPDQLEQGVHEEPCILDVAHAATGSQQLGQRAFVAVEQRVDELVFGRVVVVEVAGADAQLGGNQGGRDVGLAKPVEQFERDFQYAFSGAARRFFHHGCMPLMSLLLALLWLL
jgi:hypothetical protein